MMEGWWMELPRRLIGQPQRITIHSSLCPQQSWTLLVLSKQLLTNVLYVGFPLLLITFCHFSTGAFIFHTPNKKFAPSFLN